MRQNLGLRRIRIIWVHFLIHRNMKKLINEKLMFAIDVIFSGAVILYCSEISLFFVFQELCYFSLCVERIVEPEADKVLTSVKRDFKRK